MLVITAWKTPSPILVPTVPTLTGSIAKSGSYDINQVGAFRLLDVFNDRCRQTDLKTLTFNIDTEYESYQEKKTYKQLFTDYKYHHQMKVEVDSDNDRLGKVLYALSQYPL